MFGKEEFMDMRVFSVTRDLTPTEIVLTWCRKLWKVKWNVQTAFEDSEGPKGSEIRKL